MSTLTKTLTEWAARLTGPRSRWHFGTPPCPQLFDQRLHLFPHLVDILRRRADLDRDILGVLIRDHHGSIAQS